MTTTRAARRARAMFLAAMSVVGAGGALAADALGAVATSAASASATFATERQRIASERAAAEARFAARERECKTRFVVTACVDEAKGERRDALDKLRARQLGADEVRRRERAAQRQSELAEKAAEDARVEKERAARVAAAGASGAASQPARIRVSSPRRGAPPERAASAASASSSRANGPDKVFGFSPRAPETAASQQAREARSRAAFEKRQRRAAGHREQSTTATLQRMASKSPAAPLPSASAASTTKPR